MKIALLSSSLLLAIVANACGVAPSSSKTSDFGGQVTTAELQAKSTLPLAFLRATYTGETPGFFGLNKKACTVTVQPFYWDHNWDHTNSDRIAIDVSTGDKSVGTLLSPRILEAKFAAGAIEYQRNLYGDPVTGKTEQNIITFNDTQYTGVTVKELWLSRGHFDRWMEALSCQKLVKTN